MENCIVLILRWTRFKIFKFMVEKLVGTLRGMIYGPQYHVR